MSSPDEILHFVSRCHGRTARNVGAFGARCASALCPGFVHKAVREAFEDSQ